MEPTPKLQPQVFTPTDETARGLSRILLYRNAVLPEVCDFLIRTFQESPHKIPSHVHNGTPPHTRQGLVVNLKDEERYREAREKIFAVFQECIYDYGRRDPGLRIMVTGRFLLSHPRIEEVRPGQQFVWHMDARQNFAGTRFLTVFAYLNDVESGGETQFLQQRVSVKPEKGAVLVFPPYWTHMHRGAPVKAGIKYTAGTYAMVERVLDQPAAAASAFLPADDPAASDFSAKRP